MNMTGKMDDKYGGNVWWIDFLMVKNDGWKMEMVDDIWCGENDATNLAPRSIATAAT